MTPYFVNRVDISTGFDKKRIEKIPDPVLQKELINHIDNIENLNKSRNKEEQMDAFGSEGIEILNKNRAFPIAKVTIKEESSSKFEIRPGAYTEADKGTNLFFVIYENLNDPSDRQFESIPLRTVIEAKAAGSGFVEERPGYHWFTISPQDLVYVPNEGENIASINWNDKKLISQRIYKMVSCNKGECHFLAHSISKLILPYDPKTKQGEFGSINKSEKTIEDTMIKLHCIKLKVDRLGNISPAK